MKIIIELNKTIGTVIIGSHVWSTPMLDLPDVNESYEVTLMDGDIDLVVMLDALHEGKPVYNQFIDAYNRGLFDLPAKDPVNHRIAPVWDAYLTAQYALCRERAADAELEAELADTEVVQPTGWWSRTKTAAKKVPVKMVLIGVGAFAAGVALKTVIGMAVETVTHDA